jgi:DNA-nicking Smr family endonuclease
VSPEEEALFAEAAAGVTPLAARDRVRLDPPRLAIAPPRNPLPPTVTLTLEGEDGLLVARAPGVNRAQAAALRQGKVRPEVTLDLHGKSAAEAGPLLEQFLLESARLRRRCVLIVHGQGLHSGGVAVLRDLVIGDLVGKASGLVHAFAPAAPSDGGRGATYVMLRSS